MLELLGTACVGWTLFELSGLLHSARDGSAHHGDTARNGEQAGSAPRPRARRETPRRAAGRRSSRVRRFDAWDDRGNRIVVEDLGLR